MLMNGIVNLATTLPSAPGYIGTFDAPGIAVLTAYGVGLELATAYTLVLHAALWFPITLLGAYYFSREGLKWSADYRSEVDAERKTRKSPWPHRRRNNYANCNSGCRHWRHGCRLRPGKSRA